MQATVAQSYTRGFTVELGSLNDAPWRLNVAAFVKLGASEAYLGTAANPFADGQQPKLLLGGNDEAITPLQHVGAKFVRYICCCPFEYDFLAGKIVVPRHSPEWTNGPPYSLGCYRRGANVPDEGDLNRAVRRYEPALRIVPDFELAGCEKISDCPHGFEGCLGVYPREAEGIGVIYGAAETLRTLLSKPKVILLQKPPALQCPHILKCSCDPCCHEIIEAKF